LPVFSLIADPENLWGSQGIIDHRYNDWEKLVHVEYFGENRNIEISQYAGIKIHAPDYRAQQSFRLYARNSYGTEEFDYPFFTDKEIESYKRIIIRNAGNDGLQLGGRNTHFRDIFTHTLYQERSDHNAMSSNRPVNVFLNGNYYGIYNLRERQDKYYIEDNFGDTNIDFLERDANATNTRRVVEGDWNHYNQMMDFIETYDLSIDSNYAYVKTQMDVDDYSEYYLFNIFVANSDWLSNNVRFWRPRIETAKWRWMLWDTEYGMGRDPKYGHGRAEWNTLVWATNPGGGWPGTGDNTTLIRNLLENETFRNRFINRFTDLLNSSFRPEHTTNLIDILKANIAADAPRQIDRWGYSTVEKWDNAVDSLKAYITRRHYYSFQHIIYKFELDSIPYTLNLAIEPEGAGSIQLNTLQLDTFPWSGEYFKNIPIELIASPYPNNEFLYWHADSIFSDKKKLSIAPDTNITIWAHFAIDTLPSLVINEINYNSGSNFDPGDWVEFFNPNKYAIDITGWIFQDEEDDHKFIFPENTVIDSIGCLVLYNDKNKFESHFPDISNCLGKMDFGLNAGGEQIRIYNKNGQLIDWLNYDNESPWPQEPDGYGYTLELLNPKLDNSKAASWSASGVTGGTPGDKNSRFKTLDDIQEPTFRLKQNYPNPFNVHTNIVYQLPVAGHVQLSIYNLLGQKIHSLVNKKQSAGTYRLTFEAKHLSSGVYFIELKNSDGVQLIRKAILLK
jgi:hypothetical protein